MATVKEVLLPDIGDFNAVDVVEVLVSVGDTVRQDDSLISLESDKATMEIPSPHAGVVKAVQVRAGDKVSEGSPILTLEVGDEPEVEAKEETPSTQADEAESLPPEPPVQEATVIEMPPPTAPPVEGQGPTAVDEAAFRKAHASPSVRRFARELGVDLGQVEGSGPKGRILKEDVQAFVKRQLAAPKPVEAPPPPGFALPEMPAIDFTRFGEIEVQALSKIQRLSGTHLHRNWLHIPHVTQFDEADITELEAFRRDSQEAAQREGTKLTLPVFLMKASVAALRTFPTFNASLDPSGENLILKRYFHIGVAVDTPNGLVVPVIRDVDQKGLFELARELSNQAARARDKKLTPEEMQGGCFTISSLGGVGGTAFTPIINAPEVAILGVSRALMKPVYREGEFVPRLMLPLSLSYNHRVIDGVSATRFTSYLSGLLADIRRLLL